MQEFKIKTELITSNPSFSKGVARVFDLFGTLDKYNFDHKSDSDCIKQDWDNIGIKF